MNAEVFAMTIEPLLRTLIQDSGLKLTYKLHLHDDASIPVLTAEFFGEDLPVLLSRNAEVLLAFEHIAVKMLRLEPEHHDLISFDASGFKRSRERSMQVAAEKASAEVQRNGIPFHFPPMNSRERRILHIALSPYGLYVESEGEGRLRHVVIKPIRSS